MQKWWQTFWVGILACSLCLLLLGIQAILWLHSCCLHDSSWSTFTTLATQNQTIGISQQAWLHRYCNEPACVAGSIETLQAWYIEDKSLFMVIIVVMFYPCWQGRQFGRNAVKFWWWNAVGQHWHARPGIWTSSFHRRPGGSSIMGPPAASFPTPPTHQSWLIR